MTGHRAGDRGGLVRLQNFGGSVGRPAVAWRVEVIAAEPKGFSQCGVEQVHTTVPVGDPGEVVTNGRRRAGCDCRAGWMRRLHAGRRSQNDERRDRPTRYRKRSGPNGWAVSPRARLVCSPAANRVGVVHGLILLRISVSCAASQRAVCILNRWWPIPGTAQRSSSRSSARMKTFAGGWLKSTLGSFEALVLGGSRRWSVTTLWGSAWCSAQGEPPIRSGFAWSLVCQMRLPRRFPFRCLHAVRLSLDATRRLDQCWEGTSASFPWRRWCLTASCYNSGNRPTCRSARRVRRCRRTRTGATLGRFSSLGSQHSARFDRGRMYRWTPLDERTAMSPSRSPTPRPLSCHISCHRMDRDRLWDRVPFEDQAERHVVWDLTASFEPIIDEAFRSQQPAIRLASQARKWLLEGDLINQFLDCSDASARPSRRSRGRRPAPPPRSRATPAAGG